MDSACSVNTTNHYGIKLMFIKNKNFWRKWSVIEPYLTGEHSLKEKQYGLIIDDLFIIIGTKTKMRPVGQLDWAWYTPKTLAIAMNEGTVLQYYEKMLKDNRSDHNIWKRPEEEMEKKTYYASRGGKVDFIPLDRSK